MNLTSIFANWRTSLVGIAAILTGAGAIAQNLSSGHVDPTVITTAVGVILSGVHGLLGRDAVVSSEESGAK